MKRPIAPARPRALRGNNLLAALLVCVFLVMLLFNFLTPLCADDYSYAFSFADGSRLTNPLMIIPSMAAHRLSCNGRVFSHALVQLFLMLPKAVFNFFNAFNAAFLLVLLHSFLTCGASGAAVRARSVKAPLLVFSAAALLWCCTPDFGGVYFWLDGSCNYSWAVTFSLLYLLPFCAAFLDRDLSPGRPVQILFLLLSFLVGAYSENNACTVLFLSFVLLLMMSLRRRKPPFLLLLSFAMACLGFLFLVSSPAEQERIGLDFYTLLGHFRQVIENYCLQDLLPLFLLYAVSFALSLACGIDRRRVLLSFLFFCGALLSGFVYIFALYVPGRGFCAMAVYLVLASLLLLSSLWDVGHEKLVQAFSGFLAVFFAFSLMLGAIDIFYLSRCVAKREAVIAEAQAAGVTELALEPYSTFTKYSVFHGMISDILTDPGDWRNTSFASYYGFDAVWIDGDLIN